MSMLQLLNRCLYLGVGLLGVLVITALLALVDTTAGFLAGALGSVAFSAWAYLRLVALPAGRARKSIPHDTQPVPWYSGPPTRVLSYRSPFIPPLPTISGPPRKDSAEASRTSLPMAENSENTRKNALSVPASSLADTRAVVPLKPQYADLPLHILWQAGEEEQLQTTAQHALSDPAVEAGLNESTEFPSQEAQNISDDPPDAALS